MADLNTKYLDYVGLTKFLSKLQEYIANRISEINGTTIYLDTSKANTITSQINDLWEAIGTTEGEEGGTIVENIDKILKEYVKSINEPDSQTLPLKIQITEGTDGDKGRFTIGLVDNGLGQTITDLNTNKVSKLDVSNDGGAVTLSINQNNGEVEITVNSKELTERVDSLESNRIKSITKGTSIENYLTLGVSTTNLNTTITIDDVKLKEKIADIDAEIDTLAKVSDIPTKLPNPNSLTVKWKDATNTTQTKTHDGVDPTEVDLTEGVYYAKTSTDAVNATNTEFIGSNSNNVGGSHQPVYISGGKPTAITIEGGTSDTENCLLTEAKNSPNQIWSTTGITANYSKKTLTAEGGFIGDLQGNATTSTKSSDSDQLGGQLPSYYAKKEELTSTNENIQSIQSSYVKSVTTSNANNTGTQYVTIEPGDKTTGDVEIKINDTSIKEKFTNIDNYTVNGKKISTNPVLSAEDVKVGIGIDEAIKADTKLSTTIDEIVNRITALGKVVNLTGVYTKWEDYIGTPENGDFIIVGNKEYVYWNGWIELGDTTQVTQYLNDLINKYNSHTHSFTPTGTVTSIFAGNECTTKSISGTTTVSSMTSAGSLPTTTKKEVASKDHTHTTSITANGTVTSTFKGEQNTTSSNSLTISYDAGKLTIKSAHTHTMTPTGTIESTFIGQAVSGTSGAPSATLEIDAVASVGSLPTYSDVTVATSTHTHTMTPTGTVTSTFNGGGGTSGPTGSTQPLPPVEPAAPDSFNPGGGDNPESGGGEGVADYSKEYFTIEALEDGNMILRYPMFSTIVPSYSVNGGDWTTFTSNTTLSLKSDDKVRVKCINGDYQSGLMNAMFYGTNEYKVYGNIMSLLYGDDFVGQTTLTTRSTFYALFYKQSNLKSVENLILPATILVSNCYEYMFYGCTSLTTAPELPATTLAVNCYDSMFYGCTSLTTAPELPATTLANDCYDSMFSGCTSLTTAPELPATTLAQFCYIAMFSGCSNLNKITMLATNINASNCLTNWVSGVSSTGTFVKDPNMTSLPTGDSGIPSGWTVQDYQG